MRPQSMGQLLLLRPPRSSCSVSMSLVMQKLRKTWSDRTVSQLSSSVRARLMPSFTETSLASSDAICARMAGSEDVSSSAEVTRAPARRWKRGRGMSYCGMLALLADESVRVWPEGRVGPRLGDVGVLVVAEEDVVEI